MNGALVVSTIAAWCIGSIPTAFLVGKANGVDLRRVGSGNLGATNVFRTLGWKWGLFVYLFDAAKGMIPVLLLPAVAGVARGWPWGMVFGLAAIIGHVRPVFLLFRRGGKGVATASGVFFALTPVACLIALVVFITVVVTKRYVSLASLAGAATLPVAVALTDGGGTPLFLASLAVSLFVFITHRENIQRLMKGEEKKIVPHRQLSDADSIASAVADAASDEGSGK